MSNFDNVAATYKRDAIRFIGIGLVPGLIIGFSLGYLGGIGSGFLQSAQQISNTVEKVGDTAVDGAKNVGLVVVETYKENKEETHDAVKETTSETLGGVKEVAVAGKNAALRVLEKIGKEEVEEEAEFKTE